jgi:hypothetical protein
MRSTKDPPTLRLDRAPGANISHKCRRLSPTADAMRRP